MSIEGRSDDDLRANSHSSRRAACAWVAALHVLLFGVLLGPSSTAQADDLSDRADSAELSVELTPEESAAIAAEEETAAFVSGPQADSVEADRPTLTALVEKNAGLSETLDVGEDELWFVSSRRARVTADGPTGYDFWRYDGAGHWQSSTLAEFVAADVRLPTCFHVHGNRVDMCKANAGGWTYYTAFTCGCCKRPPLRWVIFSWPSDRLNIGPRKDVQIKAVRAECYGYYLAWLVDQLPAEASVSMIGYSFGTRVIGSSLHLLGGGSLRGRALSERRVENRAIRTVLLAAALDNDHFLPGRAMQQAPSQIDRLLIARNCLDPALKWYALLYQIMLRPRRGQQALGFTGVAGLACLPEFRERVEHRDLTCAVGREHDTHGCRYLTPEFVERMRKYVYYEPLEAGE